MIWVINKDSERRVSYFPLVNFVESVESQNRGAKCAENQSIAKIAQIRAENRPNWSAEIWWRRKIVVTSQCEREQNATC